MGFKDHWWCSRRLLGFAESSLGAARLRVPVEEPGDFHIPCLAHALLAEELAGSEPLAEGALRREDPQKVAALLKLDGLPSAIDRI